MKRFYKSLFILGVLTVLFFLPNKLAQAASVKTPMIIEVNTEKANLTQPLIIGLVEKDSDVLVYENDKFLGNAIIQSKGTETNNYYFKLNKILEVGSHSIKVIAKKVNTELMSEFSESFEIIVPELSAPTLIFPNEQIIIAKVKPYIKGLTRTNSLVHVYVDGVYNGKTSILSHDSGTANFAYKPFLNLSVGNHTVWVVAEDENGRKSKISNILKFNIEHHLPVASNVSIVSNTADKTRPFVTGLVKNGLFVKVFVDQKMDGMIKVGNHESGTIDFVYMIKSDLSAGNHFVYVVTIDDRGKESVWSNFAKIVVTSDLSPMISEVAVSDKIEDTEIAEYIYDIKEDKEIEIVEKEKNVDITEDKIKEEPKQEIKKEIVPQVRIKDDSERDEEIKNNITDKVDDKEIKENDNIQDKDVEEILSKEISTTSAEKTGAVTEDNQGQGKSWSVLIFTVFLIAVIAWILWVNRELIKEKESENEKEDNENKK
ncbi:hypothetical protein KAI92_01125 [Candidatus Parcubacteria bacterium]|nr:hypothetical protein [Candidatus Parcubacteria bacterium]